MTWLTQLLIDLRTRAAALFRRAALRDRVDEEMQFHLEMRIARLVQAGLTPDEACTRARKELGNVLVLRETAVDMWRYGSMERLIQDVRYAARMLRRAPGFTAVAVLSLALGIGANSAIFSLIDRVMLRLLPVQDPSTLVIMRGSRSYPRYDYLQAHSDRVMTGLAGVAGLSRIGVDGSEDHQSYVEGRMVSGNYFAVLGVQPFLGRTIGPEDNRVPGGHPVVVISHAFWERYFNSDPAIIGKTVRLTPGSLSTGAGTGGFEQTSNKDRSVAGGRFTIVGVTPRGFLGETIGQPTDFYAPLMMQEHFLPGRHWIERKSANWVRVIGRLRPDVTRAQAEAALTLLMQQGAIAEDGPSSNAEEKRRIAELRVELQDGSKGVSPLRNDFAQPLIVLMVMVGVVLLIACANLANLLLARASARRREISIRLAMGASRARVIRQLLTESIVLALMGGVVALAIGWWGGQTMFAMVAERDTALRLDLAPDLRTMAFTAAVALLTAILFGLAPALRATRLDVTSALKDSGQAVASGFSIGRALVVLQVALSVILLIGTGLFTRTLYNMKTQDLGYSTERVLMVHVDPIAAGYTDDAIGTICQRLLEKLRTVPGVRVATFSENGLFSGTESGAPIRIDGEQKPNRDDRHVRFDQVGPGYFTHVGIPLRAGRDFTDKDTASAPRVGVINESMARFYFGDRNPIGHSIQFEGSAKFTLTIVGVSADTRDHDVRPLNRHQRRLYVSFMQPVDGLTGANYELRTMGDPASLIPTVRAAVNEIDPKMPVLSIKPLTALIDESVLRERMIAKLSVLLGIIAVVLASVGLYGVLAYSVTRRTNEIGIRMAIGAFPRDIVWMILRETLVLVVIGIAVGVPIAMGASRYIETLLYGLKPGDAMTIAAVVVLMVGVALIAAIAPARRAAGVDPLRALRYE
jgi:predicted permease